jgi:hypothetical protein
MTRGKENPAGAETQAGRTNIQANLNAVQTTAFYHGSPQNRGRDRGESHETRKAGAALAAFGRGEQRPKHGAALGNEH